MKWIRLRIYKSPQRPRLLDFAGSKETEAGRVGDMAARGKPRGPEESRGEPSLCVLAADWPRGAGSVAKH